MSNITLRLERLVDYRRRHVGYRIAEFLNDKLLFHWPDLYQEQINAINFIESYYKSFLSAEERDKAFKLEKFTIQNKREVQT